MKKLSSLLLALIMVMSLSTTAFAADVSPNTLPSASGGSATTAATSGKTYEERVADLKTNYGITSYTYTKLTTAKYPSISEKRLNELMAEYKQDMVKVLPTVEQAYSLLGPVASKKVTSYYVNNNGYFTISIGTTDLNGAATNGHFSTGGILTLFDSTTSIRTILHEMGHAYDRGVLGNTGGGVMTKVNGAYGSNDPLGAAEDFAEYFAHMIERGGNSPFGTNTGETKNSTSHKKYVAIYELMLRDFGADSTAVKRAAAFLGI